MKAGLVWLGVLIFVIGVALVGYSETIDVLEVAHLTIYGVPDRWELVPVTIYPYQAVGGIVGLVGFVTIIIGAYVPSKDEFSAASAILE